MKKKGSDPFFAALAERSAGGVAITVAALGALLLLAAPLRLAHAESTLVEAAESDAHDAALALLGSGADPKQTAPDGTTALHWAVHNDDVDLVKRLIKAGADVTAANHFGATPMSEAAIVANPEVLKLLLDAGAAVESPNAENQTALMVVARSGNIEAAKLLIDRGANVNARELWKLQTPLMWAAAESQPEMVSLLIAHGAEVDARSKVNDWDRQVTAEPRAKSLPSGGLTPLLYAARQGCVECAKRLVDAGADIDLPDPDSVTPLLLALLNAHFDVAKYLVEQGANVNKWDWWGRNPLYAAVDYNTVPHGGRPDQPSTDATTSLDIIKLLLDKGANANAQLKLLQPFRSLGADRGADPILGIGTTPLIRAAKAGDTDSIQLLVAHGALPNLPQANGVTPLMAATGLRSYTIDTRGRFKTEQEAIASAKLLLAAGADINAQDELGQTALHGAAFQGWNDLVRFLVENGADVMAADHQGKTALDAALGKIRGVGRGATAVNPHPDTADLLKQLMASR
jgi:ankyrin repeat protein